MQQKRLFRPVPQGHDEADLLGAGLQILISKYQNQPLTKSRQLLWKLPRHVVSAWCLEKNLEGQEGSHRHTY